MDAINSVQFSNNTGYPSWRGSVATGEQLLELLEGLEANQLLAGYSHLLTGKPGSCSQREVLLLMMLLLMLTSWPPRVMQGLRHNLAAHPAISTAVSTGYIGSVSLLRTVVQVAERLRRHNPDLLYGAHVGVGVYVFVCLLL